MLKHAFASPNTGHKIIEKKKENLQYKKIQMSVLTFKLRTLELRVQHFNFFANKFSELKVYKKILVGFSPGINLLKLSRPKLHQC